MGFPSGLRSVTRNHMGSPAHLRIVLPSVVFFDVFVFGLLNVFPFHRGCSEGAIWLREGELADPLDKIIGTVSMTWHFCQRQPVNLIFSKS
jgi:hypothetical protein